MKNIVVFRNLFYLFIGSLLGRGIYTGDLIIITFVSLALVCHWLLLLSASREIQKQVDIIRDELKLENP